ncbi:MAG: CoA transferase [Deltaproteobacteria bacterium]|nr:CoA transferase [Deltaproteobacteria bacterium]
MNGRSPLSGVRVADFSVHAAGPFAGLMLAELGAEVIKIESAARLDITRRPHTMYGKPPSSFEQVNANKRSVTLNLKEPRAVELALELVSISDLVLENFRPGVMDRLGLGYPQLRQVKPDIIVVSLSANGQTGPESRYAGYAPMFAALGGLGHLTGYPDGPPVELRHAMDHTGGMLAAFCAIAALCAKSFHAAQRLEEPSLGQHVDVSVRDIATSFMGPALLDYAMNQREAVRQGNRDEAMAPHGVYRCHGDDAWVSIAIGSEEEWGGLVRALGNPAWARDDTFGDAYQRWLHQDELDRHLQAWTAQLTAQEATRRLQGEGVAAFLSLSADQLVRDPHLLARDAFPTVEHPEKGRQQAVAPPWRFSATPARIDRWTPDLGEHNLEVFHGLLGLSLEEIKALQGARVIW